MSEPKSPPTDHTSVDPSNGQPDGAVESVRPPAAPQVHPDPHTALAAAAARAEPLPMRPQRYVPPRGSLETVDWAERKPKSMFSFLFNKLFIVTVFLPTVLSAIYFGWIASDVYVSESRFVVRTPQRSQQPTLVGALLQGSGFNRAQDDAFTVHDYILSRDALKELDEKLKVRDAYAAQSVDVFNRFPGPLGEDNFESLYKYYSKHAAVEYDVNSSITTLRVSAYSAQTALDINASLLAMGEKLVNQINDRGRQDLIQYAQSEVTGAEAKAKAAALALASYRNTRAVFDPDRQSALQLQQVSKLQDELIATKIQLAQIQALSPQNPQIATLQKRAKGLEQEMANEMAKVAGGGTNSFSNKATEFERLQLERTFADRQVASALASLENARNEARRKQLYLERIVQPNLPDYALEPRRLRSVLATLVLGLIAWGIASMLLSGVKEHQA